MLQVAWLVDGDPWVLLRLRGLSPDDLQAELAAVPADEPDPLSDDLAAGAGRRGAGRRVVALADDPAAEIAHLL